MKIQCLNQNIKDAVLISERSSSKNQTLPILNSLFLGVEKDKIKIRATNLETAIEMQISGKINESGSVVIPAKTFGLFLSNLNDEQITLESQKNNLLVKTKTANTVIRGFAPEDFPIFPKIEPQEKLSLPVGELIDGISSVAISISPNDTKPELNSMFFKIFKNTLKMAATDSFRLAEKIITSKNISLEKMVSFLVPQKSVLEILKIMSKEENIEFGINKNHLVLRAPNIKFISRLIDGAFPDYEQIIPKNFKTTAIVNKAEIVSNLKVAGVFTGKLNDVSLNFNKDENKIYISSSSGDAGEHNANISAQIQGENITSKFNLRYIMDGVSQINQEYISFNLNGADLPMLVKGKNDASYSYIVMPMRGI